MSVIVVKSDCLYCQCHQSCSKKQSQQILYTKRELKFGSSLVSLDFSKLIKEFWHNQFIEKNDQEQ